jgi:hypothetical protein
MVSNVSRVVHNPDESRYELYLDDELASVADYQSAGDHLDFDHTETADRFRGRGLAAELVGWALDDVRKRGSKVVASCWFVADFIADHPEYRALLYAPAAAHGSKRS